MAKGHISEDTIKFIMEAESSQLQQEIYNSQKKVQGFMNKNKELRKEQAAVGAALGKNSKEYKELTKRIKENEQAVANENMKIHEMTKKLGISAMTMAQLKKEAKNLQRQLDNTSQSLNPQAYQEYASRLREVNDRISELRDNVRGINQQNGGSFLSRLIGSKADLSSIKSFVMGSGLTKVIDMIVSTATAAADKMREMVNEGIEMAKSADGISHAFAQLNRPDILDKLREATHGTVNDMELMKAAVQAKDFRLPLDQLGKYLEFAQLKAQQTGQSVDYMTNSIITGLGRKSLMILDNLGLSAAQVKEEMAKGGDMATAVGAIIDKQLEAQGEHYEDAAEREKRAITDVQNAQKELGDEMLPLAEAGSSMWNTIRLAAIKLFTYLVKAFKQGVAGFVDLYNSSIIVRTGVSALTVSWKTMWAACKFAFNLIGTALKTLGKQLKDLGQMIEGVFTLDFDKISKGFTGLFTDTWAGLKGQLKNFNSFGYEVGENLINGFHEAVDGHLTAPSFESTGGSSVSAAEDDAASPGDGSKTKKGKTQKDDTTELKRQRQRQLDEEKKLYNESVRLYKQQLADKQLSQQQYDAISLSLQQAYAERVLEQEKQHLKTIEEMNFNDAKKKQQAIEEQQRNILQAEEKANNARLAAYQNFQKNMEQLDESGMSDTERTQHEHELKLQALKGYYQAALQYAQDHNEELVSIDIAYQKAKEKLEKDFTEKQEKEKLSIRQQYGLVGMQQQYDQELALLKKHLEEMKLTQEEYNQAVEKLNKQHEDQIFQVRQQYGLVSQRELHQHEMEELERHHQEGMLSDEEYEKAKKQMKIAQWKEAFDYYSKLFGDAVTALQDAELANVDAKYDAEIEAARQAGEDTTELENKKANEKLKIQKKYADVNFAISASQIITQTAEAIMKALAELGPIAGPVSAALMGVTGAAQLAVANAERQKVKKMTLNGSSGSSSATGARVATGFEDGGLIDVDRLQDGKRFRAKYDPRRRGYVDGPTVIVGEGPAGKSREWVASNAALRNPTVAPLIDIIDRAQRLGNISSLDMRKYLLAQQVQGLASGGSVSTTHHPTPTTQHPTPDTTAINRLTDVLDRMERNGIPSIVALTDLDAQQKLRDRARHIGSK